MKAGLWLLLLAPVSPGQLARQEPGEGQPRSKAEVVATFVDRKGNPVAGVQVISRVWPGTEYLAESGEDGRFRVTVEWAKKSGTWYSGIVRKEGYSLERLRTDLHDGQEFDFGRLLLDPGGVLTGRVLDQSGAPLSGAMLVVVDADEHGPPPLGRREDGPPWEDVANWGTTDEQGRFQIIGVPPGRWYLSAKHETTWWHASAPVALDAGESRETATLQLDDLPDEYRIEGIVLDPHDRPVVDAEVTTSVPSPDGHFIVEAAARTNELGRFALCLPRLPEGAVDLEVLPGTDDLEGAWMSGVQPGTRNVVVRLGSTKELRLLVVDERGPVEFYGWTLSILRPESSLVGGSAPKLHEGGCATLRVPEHPFRLGIRSDAHERKDVGEFSPGSVPESLEITLTRLPVISGFVTYQGRAVPGASVELVQQKHSRLSAVLEEHWTGLYHGLGSSVTACDENGRFVIPRESRRARFQVRAWAEGYAAGLSGPVEVGDAEVRVELREGGRVAGLVQVPPGSPARGIQLEFYQDDPDENGIDSSVGRIFRTQTAEDGSFEQPHLAPGPWLVRITPSRALLSALGWSPVKIEEESHPHVVLIKSEETTYFESIIGAEECCILEGRLSVGDKIRRGLGKLLLEGPSALQLDSSGIDEEGRFRLVARDPGTYRLVIEAGPEPGQFKLVTDLVELEPGTTTWERNLPVDLWTGDGIRLDPH